MAKKFNDTFDDVIEKLCQQKSVFFSLIFVVISYKSLTNGAFLLIFVSFMHKESID